MQNCGYNCSQFAVRSSQFAVRSSLVCPYLFYSSTKSFHDLSFRASWEGAVR